MMPSAGIQNPVRQQCLTGFFYASIFARQFMWLGRAL
jgi:hypothetical protein